MISPIITPYLLGEEFVNLKQNIPSAVEFAK